MISLDEFANLPGVYILRCKVNTKMYIGISHVIRSRISQHLKGKTQLIHRALAKYGINSFDVYVHYMIDSTEDERLLYEEQLIKNMNTISPNGYNICSKGNSGIGRVHSNETKMKMSIAHAGKKMPPVSEETRKKLSAAMSGKYLNKKFGANTEETKAKKSEANKGKPWSRARRNAQKNRVSSYIVVF